MWHSKLYNDNLTARATKMFSSKDNFGGSINNLQTEDIWTDSPWPARNNAAFTSLNSFMERCNDVLELVQVQYACVASVALLNYLYLIKALYMTFIFAYWIIFEILTELHLATENTFHTIFFSQCFSGHINHLGCLMMFP